MSNNRFVIFLRRLWLAFLDVLYPRVTDRLPLSPSVPVLPAKPPGLGLLFRRPSEWVRRFWR